jgi:hypothetical protein
MTAASGGVLLKCCQRCCRRGAVEGSRGACGLDCRTLRLTAERSESVGPAWPFTGVRCELRHTLQFALGVVRIVVPVLILWGLTIPLTHLHDDGRGR